MQSHQMFWTRLRAFFVIVFLVTIYCGASFAEDSYRDTQAVINRTKKTLMVTLFRGYPVNKVENKVLKPGERLSVEDLVTRPADIYLITAVDCDAPNKKIIYQRCVGVMELMKLYELDAEKNSIPIREQDINS